MSFTREEYGQLGPFEELYELILVVILLFLFTGAVARSYLGYDERKESVERFSAGIDFAWKIKNSVLAHHVNGVPNPGLLSDSVLERGNFAYLDQFWGRPYNWEVIVRDIQGGVVYEFGSLNKDSKDPKTPLVMIDALSGDFRGGATVVYSPIALRRNDKGAELGRMEVWVW